MLAAGQDHRELRDRHVGDAVEGGADAAFEAVDPADEVDVDLALEVGDEVRQRVVRGAQVDRAFERFAEQRREGPGAAVDRFLRAVVGGELDPGADLRQAGLVEEERVRQRRPRRGRCWRRRARAFSTARRRGCLARLVCAEQPQVELRAESRAACSRPAGTGSETGRRRRPPGWSGRPRPRAACRRSRICEQLVPLRVKSLRLTLTKTERMSSLAPPKTSGIGSATAWICARLRIDVQRHPDDDGAEVERTGDRRGDDDQRERRALVAPGEVGLALDLQRRGAAAGADRGDADLAVVGAARVFAFSAAPARVAASAIAAGGQ